MSKMQHKSATGANIDEISQAKPYLVVVKESLSIP